jgi:hypothetical protein
MSLFSYVIAWAAITVGALEAARCLMALIRSPLPHWLLRVAYIRQARTERARRKAWQLFGTSLIPIVSGTIFFAIESHNDLFEQLVLVASVVVVIFNIALSLKFRRRHRSGDVKT